MRREGRVRGKPTNKSRLTGRCKAGKTRCRGCRDHPVEKSRDKRMGRHKRFAGDVRINPDLAEFLLQPPLARLPGGSMDREHELWCSSNADEGAVQLGVLASTVNSMIEAAFAKVHEDDFEVDENPAMACTASELASGASILAGNCVDNAAIESALEFGIFENAAEGSSFSQFATTRGCTLSEESWSDVDLLESEQESSVEDDWSMVDDDEDDV